MYLSLNKVSHNVIVIIVITLSINDLLKLDNCEQCTAAMDTAICSCSCSSEVGIAVGTVIVVVCLIAMVITIIVVLGLWRMKSKTLTKRER